LRQRRLAKPRPPRTLAPPRPVAGTTGGEQGEFSTHIDLLDPASFASGHPRDQYAQGVYEEKRERPTGDLASQIVHAEVDGRCLDKIDFKLFFLLLIDAGGDTTRNLVAGGLHALLDIELMEPPEWLAANFISGIRRMPIRFTPG